MFRLFFLSLILFAAGIVHLMDPYSFVNAIPLFVPWKLELVYLTGYLEILLALGLWWRKKRVLTASIITTYFILLLPIHFYVSINVIPMFGISDPFLLWGRTLFQLVFIAWAFSLRKV